MGEAKRRALQGLPPRHTKGKGGTAGKRGNPSEASPRIAPWLPIRRDQADRFVAITTRGAWIGIGVLVIFWITVRFIGPAAGWWTLADG